MAPTSLSGQVTQTSPYGRDVNAAGYPIRVSGMLATLDGPEYIERVAVNNVKNVKNAQRAIEKAFCNQVDAKMIPYYPLGVYIDRSAVKPGGKIFVDSKLIERKVERDDVEVYYIPATRMAREMGAPHLPT